MFTPHNWFWQKKNGQTYSSSKKSLIEKSNDDLVVWQQLGNTPTPWPTDENGYETDDALAEVLARYGLKLFAPTTKEIKAEFLQEIDRQAEDRRLKYLTGGVGQALTYSEKLNQAVTYSSETVEHLADPAHAKPNDDEYPLLKASLGIDGDTLLEVAETVTYAFVHWQEKCAAIEQIRLKAKQDIANAQSAADAQTVFKALTWPQ